MTLSNKSIFMHKIKNSAAWFSQSDSYLDNMGFFQNLAKGQKPTALAFCCSDSRVVLHQVTQSKPGVLFMGRNTGNIIPPFKPDTMPDSMVVAIEYAIVGLKIPEIIVCGHSNCGAMTSLVNPDSTSLMPTVAKWLNYYAAEALQNAKKKHPDHSGELLINDTIEANVLLQIEHLETHPVVLKAIAAGELNIHGWVYNVGTGEMREYSKEKNQFVPLKNDEVNTASDNLKEPSRDEAVTPSIKCCVIL